MSGEADQRDSFLDLIRAISIVRVLLLHTMLRPPVVYLPWVMWIYPGMPEVFFVSGAVTAQMLRRRSAPVVIARRVRRIALPYAFYSVCALSVMAITDARSSAAGATVPRSTLWHWLVPVLAPVGSTDRVFLWGQLWYVGAFLLLVFASPLLFWVERRIGAWVALFPLAGFAFCLWLTKKHNIRVDEAVITAFQFGVFFSLGPSYSRLRAWPWKRLVALSIALGTGGVLTALVIEPIHRKGSQELYSSRSAHLLVGAAWMVLALAAYGPIRRWIDSHVGVMRGIVGRINQRTFTMYLWGLPANGVGNAASRKVAGAPGNLAVYLSVSVLAFVGFVLMFGWIEDVAARRPRRIIPTRLPVNSDAPGRVGRAVRRHAESAR